MRREEFAACFHQFFGAPRRGAAGVPAGAGESRFACHLALDAHPVRGNNARLARRLEFVPEGRFGAREVAGPGRPRCKFIDLDQCLA